MAILHYLRDHPTAKDSAAGIAKWWVGVEQEAVEQALAILVEEGVVKKRRHIYQLAQKKTTRKGRNSSVKNLRRRRRKR